jgi:uncharacterized protein (TIGR03382 family)
MFRWVGSRVVALAALTAGMAGFVSFQATQLPVGYWNLDDAASPAVDSMAGANGTWVGTPTRITAGLPAGFSYGDLSALGFSTAGANQYVQLGSSATLDALQTGSYSISAWFRPASVPATGTQYGIVMKSAGDNEGLTWRDYPAYPGNGVFEFWHWSDPVTLVNPGSWSMIALGPNTWHHVVGVWDSAAPAAQLWLDGVQVDSRATAATGFVNSGPWRLGIANPAAAGAAQWQADGAVDDVRLYGYPLNPNQVAVLFNGVPAPTGLMASVGGGAVNLSWTAPPQAVTYTYSIGRRTTGSAGAYTVINGAPVSGTTYIDPSGTPGNSYDYVVYAISVATSGPSLPATAVAPAPAPPPPPPGPHIAGYESHNMAHRCGCSTLEGPVAFWAAFALAVVALLLRRR